MNSFSQRIGLKPMTKELQINSIDIDLQNSLWNVIEIFYLSEFTKGNNKNTDFHNLINLLWYDFYKLPINQIENDDFYMEIVLRKKFYESNWSEMYEFIEYIANIEYEYNFTEKFIVKTNEILTKEFSAYRFIGNKICPISNQNEIEEVKEAINQIEKSRVYQGINIHLTNSLDKLSNRNNPDYRNSIKESISALETIFRIVTGESALGKALNCLKHKNIIIDDMLKAGLEKIYAFTNDKKHGIRHAIIEQHNVPDFYDAKYILLMSSSLINYLIGKCEKYDIKIENN